MHSDIVILGGGISGHMMAKRLSITMPSLSIAIVDKGEGAIHPFHLHRPIPEIPGLSSLKSARLITNTWDGRELKALPTISDIMKYSLKIFGRIQVSNIYAQPDITIYPIDKHSLEGLMGETNMVSDEVVSIDSSSKTVYGKEEEIQYKYLISTIPLPSLVRIMEVKHDIEFTAFPFYTTMASLPPTGLYWMIYNVDEDCWISRLTLLNDSLFIEFQDCGVPFTPEFAALQLWRKKEHDFVSSIFQDTFTCDLLPIKKHYGRFQPLPQSQRKPLLHWLTQEHDIFCLGRYGAWTFKIANDVWDDTKQICSWIYEREQGKKFKGDRE